MSTQKEIVENVQVSKIEVAASLAILIALLLVLKGQYQKSLTPEEAWKEVQQGRPLTFERISQIALHTDQQKRYWLENELKGRDANFLFNRDFENLKGGAILAYMPREAYLYFNKSKDGFIIVDNTPLIDLLQIAIYGGRVLFSSNEKKILIKLIPGNNPEKVLTFLRGSPNYKNWEVKFDWEVEFK